MHIEAYMITARGFWLLNPRRGCQCMYNIYAYVIYFYIEIYSYIEMYLETCTYIKMYLETYVYIETYICR